MNYTILIILLGSELLLAIMALLRFKIADIPTKWFSIDTWFAAATELIALPLKDNLLIYDIYASIEVITLSFYFIYTIPMLWRKKYYRIIAVLVPLLCILLFASGYFPGNNTEMLYEIIPTLYFSVLGFIQIYLLLKNSSYDSNILGYVHFWIPFFIIMNYMAAFSGWAINEYLTLIHYKWRPFGYLYPCICILINIGLSTILFLYPKMNHQHARL